MTKEGKGCIDFLQWALPQMHLRWEGFRKVRGQVCRRIRKRIAELQLEDFDAYKQYLRENQQEWDILDQFTHIHLSRFFRDRKSWEALGEELLPELAERAHKEKKTFRCWSVACASGEEPYSIAILWKNKIAPLLPHLQVEIIATEKDEKILDRARRACYTAGSLKEIPEEWKK